MNDLKSLKSLFDKWDKIDFSYRTGNYCELLDENEPDGWVIFRRASGSEYMRMPREDYEELLKYNKTSKLECDHNWVMDRHNSGGNICSKCFKTD